MVRDVFKPALIPCCLLLSHIISSPDWLQSFLQPSFLCPYFSTLFISGWPFHLFFLTLWRLLLWLCFSLLLSLDYLHLPSLAIQILSNLASHRQDAPWNAPQISQGSLLYMNAYNMQDLHRVFNIYVHFLWFGSLPVYYKPPEEKYHTMFYNLCS